VQLATATRLTRVDEALSATPLATSFASEHHHWHCCLHECACNVGDAQRVPRCLCWTTTRPELRSQEHWSSRTLRKDMELEDTALKMPLVRLGSGSQPNINIYSLHHLHSTIDNRAANIPGMSMADYHAQRYRLRAIVGCNNSAMAYIYHTQQVRVVPCALRRLCLLVPQRNHSLFSRLRFHLPVNNFG
jgi:hypothetical protein